MQTRTAQNCLVVARGHQQRWRVQSPQFLDQASWRQEVLAFVLFVFCGHHYLISLIAFAG
jgi:hypothetical protein